MNCPNLGEFGVPYDRAGLLPRLVAEVEREFGDDRKRIDHAMQVLRHAEAIHAEEGGNGEVVMAAAALHDIGIQEAERKHGSPAPQFQEIEGPPIARRIMEDLGLDEGTVEHVCRIVANHHSARDCDTREFRILWDADWLVNWPEEYGHRDEDSQRAAVTRVLKTATGRRLAQQRIEGECR